MSKRTYKQNTVMKQKFIKFIKSYAWSLILIIYGTTLMFINY